jgi:hypothetical protein
MDLVFPPTNPSRTLAAILRVERLATEAPAKEIGPATEHEGPAGLAGGAAVAAQERWKPCDIGLFDTESREQLELF